MEKGKKILIFTALTKLLGTILTLVSQCSKGIKLENEDKEIILENLSNTLALIAEETDMEEKDVKDILMEETLLHINLIYNHNQHGET